MTWAAIFALAAGCYAFKAAGAFLGRSAALPPFFQKVLALLPAALLGALMAQGFFTTEDSVVADARIAGLVAAGAAVLLKAPFVVVVLAGGGVTALIRAF